MRAGHDSAQCIGQVLPVSDDRGPTDRIQTRVALVVQQYAEGDQNAENREGGDLHRCWVTFATQIGLQFDHLDCRGQFILYRRTEISWYQASICQAAPMTQERLGYTAKLLLDGSVLVTGGDYVDRKSQLSAEIWTSSLISWWPADRNADDIAGINDGELEDDTIFARGVKGRAFSFDGDGDYVALPSQISLSNALTVSAWVKFSEDDFDNYQSIFSDGSITLIKNGLQEENVIDFDVRFSDGEGATTSSMTRHNPGEWIHLVGTFEGSSIAIYVNGELDNGAKIAGEIAPGKFEPRIGTGEPRGKTAAPFSGLIDELRIYDRALSAEEIKAQCEAGSSGL